MSPCHQLLLSKLNQNHMLFGQGTCTFSLDLCVRQGKWTCMHVGSVFSVTSCKSCILFMGIWKVQGVANGPSKTKGLAKFYPNFMSLAVSFFSSYLCLTVSIFCKAFKHFKVSVLQFRESKCLGLAKKNARLAKSLIYHSKVGKRLFTTLHILTANCLAFLSSCVPQSRSD